MRSIFYKLFIAKILLITRSIFLKRLGFLLPRQIFSTFYLSYAPTSNAPPCGRATPSMSFAGALLDVPVFTAGEVLWR
jgi:hypothetical protein